MFAIAPSTTGTNFNALDTIPVSTIAVLQSLTGMRHGQQAFVSNYYDQDGSPSNPAGGGGPFHYDAFSTATDNSGTVIKPTAVSGAGRWLRIYSGAINVKWFGAKGDGSNDDTTAIQAAINALTIQAINSDEASAGVVHLPAGTYKVSATLAWTGPGVTIRGDGMSTTKLKTNGSNYGPVIEVNSGTAHTRFTTFEDFFIDGNSRTSGTGIRLYQNDMPTFRNLRILNAGNYGIELNFVLKPHIINCKITDSTNANVYAHSQANGLSITGGRISNSRNGAGINVDGPNTFGATISGVVVESNGLTTDAPGILIGATEAVKGVSIINPYLENNQTPANEGQIQIGRAAAVNASVGIFVNGGHYSGNANVNHAIGLGKADAVVVAGMDTAGHNVSTFYVEAGTTDFVDLGGSYAEATRESGAGRAFYRLENGTLKLETGLTSVVSGNLLINNTVGGISITTPLTKSLFLGGGSGFGPASFSDAGVISIAGISATAAQSKNLRGQVTFASAATATVTFGTAEVNNSYFISISGNVNETFWVTAKGTGGFTLNSSNATSTAVVDWHLIR
jgi:hypothetical protein